MMKQLLLNQWKQSGRGFALLGLLLATAMTLLPQRAWAQGTGAKGYGLTVAGIEVTETNASNVMGDEEVVTVRFDAATNTLTLNGAVLANFDNTDIESSLDQLTIKFSGDNTIGAVVSTKETATLTIALAADAEEESSLDMGLGDGYPWSGFSGNPTLGENLVYLPNADSRFIKKLPSPFISYEDTHLTLIAGDGYGTTFDCYYAIDYVDASLTDVTATRFDASSNDPVTLAGPCTVTAYATYTDVLGNTATSENATGVLVGFANSEISIVKGESASLPAYLKRKSLSWLVSRFFSAPRIIWE